MRRKKKVVREVGGLDTHGVVQEASVVTASHNSQSVFRGNRGLTVGTTDV